MLKYILFLLMVFLQNIAFSQRILSGSYWDGDPAHYIKTSFTFSKDGSFEYNVYTCVGGTSGKGTFLVRSDLLILMFKEALPNATFKKNTVWKYYIKRNDSHLLVLNKAGKETRYLKE